MSATFVPTRPRETTATVLARLQSNVCAEPVQIGIGYKSGYRPAIVEQQALISVSKIFKRDFDDENEYAKFRHIDQDERIYYFGAYKSDVVKVFLFWLTNRVMPTISEVDGLALADQSGYQLLLARTHKMAEDYKIKLMENAVISSLLPALKWTKLTFEVLQKALVLSCGNKLREALLDEALQVEKLTGTELINKLDKRWLIGIEQDIKDARQRAREGNGRRRDLGEYLINAEPTPEPEFGPRPRERIDGFEELARIRRKAKHKTGYPGSEIIYVGKARTRKSEKRKRADREERELEAMARRFARRAAGSTSPTFDRSPSPDSLGRSPSLDSDRLDSPLGTLSPPGTPDFDNDPGFDIEPEDEPFNLGMTANLQKSRDKYDAARRDRDTDRQRKKRRTAPPPEPAIDPGAPTEAPAECACFFDYRYFRKKGPQVSEPHVKKCPECHLAKRPWEGWKFGWRAEKGWCYVKVDAEDGWKAPAQAARLGGSGVLW